MPAILKGFFDRVITPRFAFKYEGLIPKGLLKGKKAIVFFTTGGPTPFYKLTGNQPKRNITMILKFCAIKTKVYQFGSAKKLTKDRKIKIEKTVKKALSGI